MKWLHVFLTFVIFGIAWIGKGNGDDGDDDEVPDADACTELTKDLDEINRFLYEHCEKVRHAGPIMVKETHAIFSELKVEAKLENIEECVKRAFRQMNNEIVSPVPVLHLQYTITLMKQLLTVVNFTRAKKYLIKPTIECTVRFPKDVNDFPKSVSVPETHKIYREALEAALRIGTSIQEKSAEMDSMEFFVEKSDLVGNHPVELFRFFVEHHEKQHNHKLWDVPT